MELDARDLEDQILLVRILTRSHYGRSQTIPDLRLAHRILGLRSMT